MESAPGSDGEFSSCGRNDYACSARTDCRGGRRHGIGSRRWCSRVQSLGRPVRRRLTEASSSDALAFAALGAGRHGLDSRRHVSARAPTRKSDAAARS